MWILKISEALRRRMELEPAEEEKGIAQVSTKPASNDCRFSFVAAKTITP